MKTWPLAVHRGDERTYIGVPDRLGDGTTYRDLDAPSLEEIAGERWSQELLSRMLPTRRAWAWWTRTEIARDSRLVTRPAPERLDLRSLVASCSRRLLLKGTTLVVVPHQRASDQDLLLEWAGTDTEQIPDHIWTEPDEADEWDTDQIMQRQVFVTDADPRRWGPGEPVDLCLSAKIPTSIPSGEYQIGLALPDAAAALAGNAAFAIRFSNLSWDAATGTNLLDARVTVRRSPERNPPPPGEDSGRAARRRCVSARAVLSLGAVAAQPPAADGSAGTGPGLSAARHSLTRLRMRSRAGSSSGR